MKLIFGSARAERQGWQLFYGRVNLRQVRTSGHFRQA